MKKATLRIWKSGYRWHWQIIVGLNSGPGHGVTVRPRRQSGYVTKNSARKVAARWVRTFSLELTEGDADDD